MKNKTFHQTTILLFSIMCSVVGIIYSIDGLSLLKEMELESVVNSAYANIFLLALCIICITTIITSIFCYVCSFFYENKSVKTIFDKCITVVYCLLYINVFIIFIHMINNRLTVDTIEKLVQTESETELEKFTLNQIISKFIYPIGILNIVAFALNFVAFSIYSIDNVSYEVEITNLVDSQTQADESDLERDIKLLEAKLKEKELKKKYDALLKKLEEE